MHRCKPPVLLCGLLILALASSRATAMLLTPAGIVGGGVGSYNNDPNLIIDGFVPLEGSSWSASTNVWWFEAGPIFFIDLGDQFRVEDVLVSVDNNDPYFVGWSQDAVNWDPLFVILASYGEIAPSPGGMDTMSTDDTHPEYVSQIDFLAVNARYLQISGAIGGDARYSIGEMQVFGSSVVPLPAAAWLFASALLGFVGLSRRRSRPGQPLGARGKPL